MARLSWSSALLAALASPAVAQLSGWTNRQINASICTWQQPRAALIRDTVYLDGGQLYWSPGMEDNQYGPAVPEANYDGKVFMFNLSNPIEKDTNVSRLLIKDPLRKFQGNAQQGYFVDGAMLYNDAEAFLYGGVFTANDEWEQPASDDVYLYQAYDVGPDKPLWDPSFRPRSLSKDVTRYVAYGGAASAPSEDKAWYFSGLTSPSHGEIDTVHNRNYTNWAQDVSDRLITVDLGTQGDEKWTNGTIGDDVDGRANPEVVWVPVGKEGILVVLGGVTYPQWAYTETSQQSDDPKASKNESTEFMKVIDVYDIAGDKWYKQPTEDGPGPLTRGCAVVAVASDRSSFNIYYYGGFDGVNFDEPYSDEVWVLSLPSFTWTKVNEGKSLHARAGHRCFKPYDDQMMVFGGDTSRDGSSIKCLDGGPIVTFNLSSAEWMDEYHPDKYDDYAVPTKVSDKIGGDGAGAATMVQPSPSWATRALGEVFGESYDMKKITTWGPYNATESTDRPTLPNDEDDDGGGGGGGLPSWVAPVLGVIIGLIVLITALVLFCLWKRRGLFKNRSTGSSTEDGRKRIMTWMRGHQAGQPGEKAVTMTTTEETPGSPNMVAVHGLTPQQRLDSFMAGTTTATTTPGLELPPNRYEVADTQVAELHDTSPPAELPDSPLSHKDVLLKHSRLGKGTKNPSSYSSPSYSSFSFAAGGDYTSSISRSSAAANSSAPLAGNRDTPPGGGSTPDPDASRVTSGVSGLSDTDASHLRHVSETSIDGNLASNSATPPTGTSAFARPAPVREDSETLPEENLPGETPISPPTAGESPGEDYISARQTMVSPLRKSVFRESEEDMRRE